MPEEAIVAQSLAVAPREKLPDAFLKHLFDAGVVAVVSWDTGGRIEEANDYFIEVVGYSRDELESGHLTWARLSPSNDHAVIERLTRRPASGRARRAQGVQVLPQGQCANAQPHVRLGV